MVLLTVVLIVIVDVTCPTTTAAAETPVTPLFRSIPPPSPVPDEPLVRTVTRKSTKNGIAVPVAAAVGVTTAAAESAELPAVPIRTRKLEAFAADEVQTPE